MKTAITALLIVISITAFGQQNQSKLVGKWEFQDVYQKEKIDSTGLEMIQMFFGNMTFQFNSDNLYKAIIMDKEDQGKWEIQGNETIALSSDNGNTTSLELIELTNEKLIFKLQSGAFIMTKVQEPEMSQIVKTEKAFETVPATKKQVSKKWFLQGKESSKNIPQNIKEAANDLLKGTYLHLFSSGKYQTKILGLKEKGKWKFGDNSESIITMKNGNQKTWNIVSVSETKLVLIQGLSNEKWTFVLEE